MDPGGGTIVGYGKGGGVVDCIWRARLVVCPVGDPIDGQGEGDGVNCQLKPVKQPRAGWKF